MKSTKKITILVVSIVILGVLVFQFINGTGPFSFNDSNDASGPEQTETVHVERVVDGDTLVARSNDNEQMRVRLIGIDTPETVKPNTSVQPYGEAASGYSKAHLTDKDIHLEYDKEKEDHYGRTLAYVWLDKEILFNEELVRKGLAREKYYAPNGKYRDLFEKAEQEAKNNKENIWS